MKTLTTAEKIDYLSHSDTPLTTSLAGVLQHHLGYEPPCENATPNSPSENDFVRALSNYSRKRQKLEALPPAEIDLLFALARNAELKKTELQRLYNQPRAQADFPQWAKLPRWTVDETVALLFGKNPGLVNERYLEQFKYDDELAALERGRLGIGSLDATVKRSFSRQYKDLVTLVTRSEIFLPGTQFVDPVSVVSWARGNNIPIPAQLEAVFAGKNARTVTWMTTAAEPPEVTPSPASTIALEPQAMPVVAGKLGATAQTPDPERRLARLRTLGGEAKYAQGKWHFTGIKKLVEIEKFEDRNRSDEKTVRADLKQAANEEREAKRAGFGNGLGQR